MNEVIEVFLSSIIMAFVEIYIWNNLLKTKIKLLSIKTIILALLCSVVITFNYLLNFVYLKFICITLFFSLIIKFIYKKSFVKSISVAAFGQIIMSLSEIIFVILMMSYKTQDVILFKEIFFSKFYTNLFISLLSMFIINIFEIKKFFCKMLDLIIKVKIKQLLFLLISILLSINLLFGIVYYQLDTILIVLIIGILLLIYTYITLQSITQQEHIANIRVEYDSLMDKAVEYEQILNENRRDLHELKNDFSVLKVLIEKSKKDALKHLDFMFKEYGKVESGLTGNSKCYNKTLRVPSGGLRGLLSTKLKLMEDMKIDYNLRISKDINAKIFKSTKSDYVRQIGKLLGIYLDNAINAVSKLNEKNINVEIFVEENCFNILISNNLGGMLELDKFGSMGYTTNGDGHGYGLALAQEILKNNKKIKVRTLLSGSVLTKVITLKI